MKRLMIIRFLKRHLAIACFIAAVQELLLFREISEGLREKVSERLGFDCWPFWVRA